VVVEEGKEGESTSFISTSHSMLDKLAVEVLQRAIQNLDTLEQPSHLSRLALVSRRLSNSIRDYRTRHPVFQSSTQAQHYLGRRSGYDTEAESVTIRKGHRKRMEQVKVGRQKVTREVEDSVTAEELVALCQTYAGVVQLRLEEPAFTSLRRRQINFAASLSKLTILSIIGRLWSSEAPDDAGFNLTTVGQVLNTVPQLKHLELRNLRSSRTSLSGIPPPSFTLTSFSLFTTPFLTSSQLSWLLSSSTQAESLRTIDFNLPSTVYPYQLHSIYWAPIRVTTLSIECENPRVIEYMPLHCPHLERIEFKLVSRRDKETESIDARLLLKNAIQYRRLQEIRDQTSQGGMDLRSLAEGLLLYRKKVSIRRISIWAEKRREDGFRELEEVCKVLGIGLEVLGGGE
jgi:hypothetical protein